MTHNSLTWPTTSNLTGNAIDESSYMDTSWSATDVIESTTTGTIGMYGANDVYYFYCYFQADNLDRWWTNTSGATKDFILLF